MNAPLNAINAINEITSSHTIKTSPVGEDLSLVGFVAKEGFGITHGCTILECQVKVLELADHIEIEKSSTEMSVWDKSQRDVDATRVKGLDVYSSTREDTIFPGMIMFASEVELGQRHVILGRELQEFTLKSDIDRHMADGQGRSTMAKMIKEAQRTHMFDHTFNVKVVITHTEDLSECQGIMRQVFSDLHANVKTPNSSVNLLFNGQDPLNRLIDSVMDMSLPHNSERTLRELIAGHGKLEVGQLWTYRQFADSFKVLFATTDKELKETLADEEVFDIMKEQAVAYYHAVLSALPIQEMDGMDKKVWSLYHKNALYSKALCLTGLAFLGQSIMKCDRTTFADMEALSSIPLNDIAADIWLEKKVTHNKDDKVMIMKSCQKDIGKMLCRAVGAYPCVALD